MAVSHASTIDRLEAILRSDRTTPEKLQSALRRLAIHRSRMIETALVRAHGTQVMSGPFMGLQFGRPDAGEGCFSPKILGCYEAELHAHLTAAAARDYNTVINIVAAEGYYAVGLARLMPRSRIVACDTNVTFQRACEALAARNGVADRIHIRGEFNGDDFQQYGATSTLVLCDIEGAEMQLLDPERFPALRSIDIIVELHKKGAISTADVVPERFLQTHDVEVVQQSGRDIQLPPPLCHMSHLDQLLAVWEWRASPTPWAVMIAKVPPSRSSEGSPVQKRERRDR